MSSENKTAIPNSLNEHWMPFTSNKDFKENPRLIVEASTINLGFSLKSLLDVNGIQCSFNEFGIAVLFSELICFLSFYIFKLLKQ